MSGRARIDMVEGRRRVVRPESAWWRCDINGCARIDTVRVGDKRFGSSAHGGGETRAVGPELTWWRQEMSNRAQERVVEVGHEWSGSN